MATYWRNERFTPHLMFAVAQQDDVPIPFDSEYRFDGEKWVEINGSLVLGWLVGGEPLLEEEENPPITLSLETIATE